MRRSPLKGRPAMTLRNPAGRFSRTGASCLATMVVAAVAFTGAQSKSVAPVAPAALQKLLPTSDGWTGGAARADVAEMSPEAKYSFTSQTFTKDDQRVKITLADTGFSADCLAALATMVVTMPDDYSGEVGGLA